MKLKLVIQLKFDKAYGGGEGKTMVVDIQFHKNVAELLRSTNNIR